MVTQTRFVRVGKLGLAGLLFAGSAAVAPTAMAEIIGPGLTVYAFDSLGNMASAEISGAWSSDGQTFNWSSTSTIELWDQDTDTLLGCMNPLDANGNPTFSAFQYVQDPVVNLNFAVQAGSADTTFVIASSMLSFPTINSAQAAASAGFSVTDFNGNGASLTGLVGTGSSFGYLAQYNGFAFTQSGTTFAEVLPAVAAGAFGTNTVSSNVPGAGFSNIGTVSDMSSLISFRLSRFDLASGTTSFVITPEPASIALLGLGALAMLRRRA
ncbi:MAG: PEP-CTERM sorting domain-containing protein [Phycisphaerae bacterium]